MTEPRALCHAYPRRWDVPLCILAAIAALTVGLNLPVLRVEKLIFWKDEYSIWSGVVGLFRDAHYGLAALLLFFSVLFPYAKLLTLLALWFAPLGERNRRRSLAWLKVLGKWSMLDVFVVALIVVMAKAGGLLQAQPRLGIYIFAAAIIASMLVTTYLDRLARRADRRPREEDAA